MTPEDVTFALYETLISAGVHAFFSGGAIEFIWDYDREEVREVQLTYGGDTPGDETVSDWLEMELTVAARVAIEL